MPTYEYECLTCRHTLEIDQKITEQPIKKCPECKKHTLQRVIGGLGFRLKGYGWTGKMRRR